MACADVAVASSDAVFGFSEVKLGIIPAVISPFVLAKIGAQARRYFLTGERFDAGTALRIGLVRGDGRPRRDRREHRRRDPDERARGRAPGEGARSRSTARGRASHVAARRRTSPEGQEGYAPSSTSAEPNGTPTTPPPDPRTGEVETPRSEPRRDRRPRRFDRADQLGIAAVAVAAPDDEGAFHTRRASGSQRVSSYLDAGALVGAAQAARADAVHPGCGFLAENAEFAEAVSAAGRELGRPACAGPPRRRRQARVEATSCGGRRAGGRDR